MKKNDIDAQQSPYLQVYPLQYDPLKFDLREVLEELLQAVGQ